METCAFCVMKFFSENMRWYKGNTHAHTTASDGVKTPEEAMALYQGRGYDFLALTDHAVQSENGRYKNMLLLSGVELDTTVGFQGYHIVGLGMEKDCTWAEKKAPQAMIDAICAAGGRAILAHPAWSLLLPADMAALERVTAAEVYNSLSLPPINAQRGESGVQLDIASALGRLFPLVAADDSHWYRGEECRGITMVQAEELSREGILAALDAGRFYATTGPKIRQVTVEDGRMTVECSPCAYAVFYSDALWSAKRVVQGPAERFSYQLLPTEHFVRCEVVDEHENKAWTSPVSTKGV